MGIRSWIRSKISSKPRERFDLATLAAVNAMLATGMIRGTYDAARNSTEFQNYWANTDRYDADSAHSKEVRHTLIARSRYEIGSNGFSDGIAQTAATDLIGNGPALRMQTASVGFNQLVEREWFNWCQATQFRRKLWTMAHAKHSDGETFGVLRRNPGVKHAIKLDVVLVEAEQVQTPYLSFDDTNRIDGIKFDEFGNPLWYEVLRQHPGMSNGLMLDPKPEQIAADAMLHWFKMRRPGQHRGVPEMASTLNTGAASRRWREATLAAAETAAEFAVLLKTQLTPDSVTDDAAPFSQQEITKRMMTALPMGWDATQLKPEHPSAEYASFHKTLVNEQARPKSMPYNKAACDSSSYNYASGRLDHQTYYAALDVEREDCNDLVLDKLFGVWFDLAVLRFGWLGGNPEAISVNAKAHGWDWPKHRVADVQAEAEANKTKLTSGQIGLHRLYTDAGLDLEDEIPAMATTYGVGEEVIRQRLLDIVLPPPKQVQPAGGALPQAQSADALGEAILKRLNGHAALLGANHG